MTSVKRSHTVNMADVDLIQVNFSRFFVWMDDGYGALQRELGHPLSQIIRNGFATPVVDARCEYRRPVGLDDEFEVTSAVVAAGRTSFSVGHLFEDSRGVFAVGRCVHVWVRTEPQQQSEALPAWITGGLEEGFFEGVGGPR
ncbi:acyl-CoA thioesterase [Microbacterium aurantiacum]|uniref:acyl-CoA thioesterase n=1 Tax=Microbacterium aurantiacum TaxID=162393 RepID=UPI0034160620